MKDYKKLIWALPVITAMTGCTDFIDNTDYTVDKPENIAQYEYLNSYGTLKSYIDRGAHSGFLLGTGVSADDYLKRTGVFLLTNSNFDQVTTGNAMKYASIVNDKGEMDFGKVRDFVSAATEAGLEVYGHTLCWHEQQTVKWLNSLIKDKELEIDPNEKLEVVDYELDYSTVPEYNLWNQHPEGTNIWVNTDEGCLQVDNPASVGFWEVQYFTFDNVSLTKGETYQMSVTIKGTGEGTVQGNVGSWGGNAGIRFSFTEDWTTETVTFVAGDDAGIHGLFQTGDFVGTVQYKSIKISHFETPVMEVEQELKVKTYEDGPFPFYAMGCEPPVINGAIHFVPTGDWSQFFILPGGENNLSEGDYVLYLDITSDNEVSSGIQLTVQNGWGGDAQAITLPVPVEAGNNRVRLPLNDIEGGAYDVILKPQTSDAVLDVKSVTVCKVEKMNSIPLTPEEKRQVLEAEMERWVKGMMEATEGKVKAWDVVNEPLSGGGGWPYPMQSASTATDDTSNRFYWQDYLGDNYVRVPIKFARKYFAENGGNPADLKLFINDYNLESDWDDNGKVKSLVEWITRWESDGETVIDGIGTQMHVSYYMNPETQASKEEHIVKMFEILAASGKLIRITELDMGICDAKGKDILTKDVTFEQHQAMAEFYKFIVEKYFEIIPAAQQYGICAWAQTDSPEGSGWRPGQPIGLWNSNLERKPAYGGFCDGLAGK